MLLSRFEMQTCTEDAHLWENGAHTNAHMRAQARCILKRSNNKRRSLEGLIVTPKTQPPPRPSAIALSPPTAAAAAVAAALRNETKSPQTISKDNAFIKTYSSSSLPPHSLPAPPEARLHQQRSRAERRPEVD